MDLVVAETVAGDVTRCTTARSTSVRPARVRSTSPTVVRVRHDSTQTAQREADEGSASAVASAALTTRASTPRSPTAAVRREVRLRPQSEGARTTTSRSVAEAHRNALATGAAAVRLSGTRRPARRHDAWTYSSGQRGGVQGPGGRRLDLRQLIGRLRGNDGPSIPSTDAEATAGPAPPRPGRGHRSGHDRSTASTCPRPGPTGAIAPAPLHGAAAASMTSLPRPAGSGPGAPPGSSPHRATADMIRPAPPGSDTADERVIHTEGLRSGARPPTGRCHGRAGGAGQGLQQVTGSGDHQVRSSTSRWIRGPLQPRPQLGGDIRPGIRSSRMRSSVRPSAAARSRWQRNPPDARPRLPEHGPSVVHDELGVRGSFPAALQRGRTQVFPFRSPGTSMSGSASRSACDRQIGLIHAEHGLILILRGQASQAGNCAADRGSIRTSAAAVADPGAPSLRQVTRGRCGRVRHPLGVDRPSDRAVE